LKRICGVLTRNVEQGAKGPEANVGLGSGAANFLDRELKPETVKYNFCLK